MALKKMFVSLLLVYLISCTYNLRLSKSNPPSESKSDDCDDLNPNNVKNVQWTNVPQFVRYPNISTTIRCHMRMCRCTLALTLMWKFWIFKNIFTWKVLRKKSINFSLALNFGSYWHADEKINLCLTILKVSSKMVHITSVGVKFENIELDEN